MVIEKNTTLSIPEIYKHDTEIHYIDNGIQPSAENGTNPTNCYNPVPKNYVIHPADTYIKYAYYAREHLANNDQVSDLEEFLKHLNDDADLYALYDLKAIIFEFETIEHQYFRLHRNISFVPFYEALNKRIQKFENSNSQSANKNNDGQKVIKYLKAAVKSRLNEIKPDEKFIYSINLLESLENMREIETLKESSKGVEIGKKLNEFKKEIEEEKQIAEDRVQKVLPHIENQIMTIPKLIDDMLKELRETENNAKYEAKKARLNEETIRERLVFHVMLAPLKLAQTALTLFGPEGKAASEVAGAGLAVIEMLVDLRKSELDVHVPDTKLIKKEVDRISNDEKRQFKELEWELHTLSEALEFENSNEIEHIKSEMANLRNTIQPIVKTNRIQNVTIFEKANEACQKFINGLQNLTKHLEEFGQNKKIVTALTRTTTFMKFGQTGLQIFKQVSGDYDKLDALRNIIEQIDEKVQTIRQHRLNIFYVMMPQLQLMSQAINTVSNHLEGKSRSELIHSQWSIKIFLKHISDEFHKMSKNSVLNYDIKNCVDEISDSMDTIIRLYDQIEQLKEKEESAEFTAILSEIISSGNVDDYEDPNLKYALAQLTMKIYLNIVHHQYENAINALKPRKFPFAKNYTSDDSILYSSLSEQEIVNTVIAKVQDLIQQLKDERGTIQFGNNKYWNLHSDFIQSSAFYKWEYGKQNDDIKNLFNGSAVLLNADIKRGNNEPRNAIKFRHIWIRIVLKNPSKQKDFDRILSKFEIHMTMVGNQYSRCDKRIYEFVFENSFEFKFQIVNDALTNLDSDYDLYSNGDPFLSPYSTWKIYFKSMQRNERDFDQLMPFAKEVSEIFLEGDGKYLTDDKKILQEFCTEELDNYYHFAGLMTDN